MKIKFLGTSFGAPSKGRHQQSILLETDSGNSYLFDAGAPVLDVILKEEITNVVIVVTRYFGGTLLGTGGLIKAYSSAAKAALNKTDIVVMTSCIEFIISIPYTLLGKCENEFRANDVIITKKEFTDDVNIIAICRENNYEKLCEKFKEISNGKLALLKTRELFYGFKE